MRVASSPFVYYKLEGLTPYLHEPYAAWHMCVIDGELIFRPNHNGVHGVRGEGHWYSDLSLLRAVAKIFIFVLSRLRRFGCKRADFTCEELCKLGENCLD